MYLIGTAGPKVRENIFLKSIIESGMNVLRLNFSHGSEEEFNDFLNKSRSINNNIKILLDVSGTKIRVSDKFKYIYKVYNGEEIFFCGEDKYDIVKRIYTNKKVIPLNIKEEYLHENKYEFLSIKDNTMQFSVTEITHMGIKVKTISGGVIRRGKGCNIKGFDRSSMELSEKDKRAILWGIENKVEFISQSFVESKNDILTVKEYIKENSKEYNPKIWAKIETLSGVNNITEILEVSDGIIIGRGDMIPETSLEDTPIYEGYIIDKVREYNKDIIVATHILDSMRDGKRATISEVESIYSFIRSGVNGFILAGETSVGRTPIKSVKFLKSLLDKYE